MFDEGRVSCGALAYRVARSTDMDGRSTYGNIVPLSQGLPLPRTGFPRVVSHQPFPLSFQGS